MPLGLFAEEDTVTLIVGCGLRILYGACTREPEHAKDYALDLHWTSGVSLKLARRAEHKACTQDLHCTWAFLLKVLT